MRNVLMVSPCFSPSSYPPSLRNRIFALHLKSFGWNPIILTIEPRYMEGPRDPIFEKMIPEDLEVVRTQAFPYQLTRKFGIVVDGARVARHLESWPVFRRTEALTHRGIPAGAGVLNGLHIGRAHGLYRSL